VFKLTIEDDEGKTTVVPVIRDEMTIGRHEGNTIRLTDRNVSRRHARLMRQNGSIFVEDLKSFTGVRVNGSKIAAPTAVSESDQLQIGDYKIRLKSDRPALEPMDRATRPTMAAVNGNGEAGTPFPAVVTAVPAPARTPAATQPNTSVTSMGRAVTPRPAPTRLVADLMPAPDPIEAQPTIPLRMLSEMDPALGDGSPVQEAPATPARLVVLTTELAGREFVLERASLVIGRTNENDVVLNHRSISRHHAKIVQDRDHFTIVDLQSANGVRVNGEDYERIELHAGDVVELGHVRMRFVGPAEHFVYDPASRAGRGRASKIGFALAGVALAGAIALIVQRTLTPRDDGGSTGASVVAVRPTPVVPSSPAAIATAPVPVPPRGPSSEDLLTQAAAQAKNDEWDTALATLNQLSTQAGAAGAAGEAGNNDVRAQAAELRKRVDSERRNAIAFAKFDESFQQNNHAAAIDWYTEIPEDSVYKLRAQPRFEETRAAFVAQHLLAAEKLRAAGRCADLKQEIELISRVDPRNAAARDKLRACRPRMEASVAVNTAAPRPSLVRAAASSPAARPEPASAVPAKRAPPAIAVTAAPPARRAIEVAATPAAEGESADADALLKQARDAWLKQQCGSAIDLSRKAIRARPGMVDAYQVIAVCSCSLKDAEGATRAYAKLDDKSRNLVRTLCQRNGITVSAE
jgi:pSer/pThr/pTyr-binding forkhead associated (FHA) protein